MIQLISGLIASSMHVISGPDHLAAVTPLAIESKKKAWTVGLFWGIGHLLGMLLIGGLFMLFRDLIPVEKISVYSEQLVGIVLIGVGLWAILKVYLRPSKSHKHPHYHTDPEPHVHIHNHRHHDEFTHDHTHKNVQRQTNITALGIGTLHGFAGISHFLLILPTLALPSLFDAAMYLTGFGAGTILAMAIYAFILGWFSARTSKAPGHRTFNILRISGGLIAIAVGIYWLMM